MFLRQLNSKGIIWSVCVYYVALWRIWVVKDRCFQQCTFEGVECCKMGWCPDKHCIVVSKGCQWLCYVSKIFNELTVVTNKSQECSELFSILGGFITLIAAVLEGSGLMSVLLRTWPKYWISLVKKWYLLNIMVNSELWSLWKTWCKWSSSFAVLLYKKYHPSRLRQRVSLLMLYSSVLGNMPILVLIQRELTGTHISQMEIWRLFWI